jgi:hypothetical protein
MKNITIRRGQVYQGNEKIGEAIKSFKFGYHPAVLATFESERKWFELHDPDLLAKVIGFFKENIKRKNKYAKRNSKQTIISD